MYRRMRQSAEDRGYQFHGVYEVFAVMGGKLIGEQAIWTLAF